MDFSSVIAAVSAVGFPIVCCLMMGYYVKYTADRQREDTKELNKQHTQEMMIFKDEIKDALGKMTLVLTQLCERLEKEDKD